MDGGGREGVVGEHSKTLALYSGSVSLCVIVHSSFHWCLCTERLS